MSPAAVYTAPYDTSQGFQGIPYAGRDDDYFDQIYYVGDGNPSSITLTLQMMDIKKEIAKSFDFTTEF